MSSVQDNALLGLVVTSVTGLLAGALTLVIKRLRRSNCCGITLEMSSTPVSPVSSNTQAVEITPVTNRENDVVVVNVPE